MNITFPKRFLLMSACTASMALSFSCSGGGPQNNSAATPTPQSNRSTPAPNTNAAAANQPEPMSGMGEGFSITDVCALPADAGAGTPFAGLGGGMWEQWEDTGGEWGYSCNRGRDSIMVEEVVAKIRAGYSVLGDAQEVRVVSATYVALQYGGKTKEEAALRPQFAGFCDGLSKKLFGQPLTESFRSRILNESVYSEASNAADYTEKIGKGTVALNARKEKDQMVRLEVNFFPNAEEYQRFKKS